MVTSAEVGFVTANLSHLVQHQPIHWTPLIGQMPLRLSTAEEINGIKSSRKVSIRVTQKSGLHGIVSEITLSTH